jgi:hypothetical protein
MARLGDGGQVIYGLIIYIVIIVIMITIVPPYVQQVRRRTPAEVEWTNSTGLF